MVRLMVAAAVLVACGVASLAAWDPGGNTPPNAAALTRAAGVRAPIERTDTTREFLTRATGNGGN